MQQLGKKQLLINESSNDLILLEVLQLSYNTSFVASKADYGDAANDCTFQSHFILGQIFFSRTESWMRQLNSELLHPETVSNERKRKKTDSYGED